MLYFEIITDKSKEKIIPQIKHSRLELLPGIILHASNGILGIIFISVTFK